MTKHAIISKQIVVQHPTRLCDLKVGDIVITAELHEVREIRGRDDIEVTDIGEHYGHIMGLGWGQQCILKVIAGVKKRTKGQ